MIYEPVFGSEHSGVQIEYHTNKRKYNPVHWHKAIEVIYILNGHGKIMLDREYHKVIQGEFIVVDSNEIHEIRFSKNTMMVILYFSRTIMGQYLPNLEQYHLSCLKSNLSEEKLSPYFHVCDLFKELTKVYISHEDGYLLKSQAISLDIFYILFRHFSQIDAAPVLSAPSDKKDLERVSKMLEFIETHYKEQISLERISSEFYLTREYFSRYFKMQVGVPFLQYLNQVRLIHIYQDLCNTDDGILEITERHGFTNYKLFSRLFKDVYGCTPRELRVMNESGIAYQK